jgi:hypothetical protein
VKVQKKYEEKGLVILALHRGPEIPMELVRVARLKKWPYSIYTGGAVKGYELGGNPQPFIFNHEGKMIFDPKYGVDFMAKTSKFADEAPDWLVGAREFEHLDSEARAIESRRNMGSVLTDLEEKVKTAEGKEKEEAEYLLGRLTWYAEWLNKKAAQKIEDGLPSEALDTLDQIGKLFRGHEIGDKAEEEEKQRKADKDFKEELSAERAAENILKVFYRIQPKKDGEDSDKWAKRYGSFIKQSESKFKDLEKKYGSTKVFNRIKEIVADLGIR